MGREGKGGMGGEGQCEEDRDGWGEDGRERGREGCGGQGRRETEWKEEGRGRIKMCHLHTTHTQEEYDIVTNDYEKAKSLFAGTQVKVFKKGTKQLPM